MTNLIFSSRLPTYNLVVFILSVAKQTDLFKDGRTDLDVFLVQLLGEGVPEEVVLGAQVVALVFGPLHVLFLPAKVTPVVRQAQDQVETSLLRFADHEVESLN